MPESVLKESDRLISLPLFEQKYNDLNYPSWLMEQFNRVYLPEHLEAYSHYKNQNENNYNYFRALHEYLNNYLIPEAEAVKGSVFSDTAKGSIYTIINPLLISM